MEFLRFGSSIPGEYWGCCAVDIIQNFKQDPDTLASIELISGDGGGPLMKGNGAAYLGPTLRDIFWQRLRISTFNLGDKPNHTFLAVLEHSQIQQSIGKKWLALLKEAGFEFIRTIDNSVYTGEKIGGKGTPHRNYIFGLFRNIGNGRIDDSFTPPKEWTDLPKVCPEAWEFIPPKKREATADEQRKAHTKVWDDHGPTTILTRKDIEKAGAPLIAAGRRSEFPPMLKEAYDKKMAQRQAKTLDYMQMPGTQILYSSSKVKVAVAPALTIPATEVQASSSPAQG